jgi:hypothetical protein
MNARRAGEPALNSVNEPGSDMLADSPSRLNVFFREGFLFIVADPFSPNGRMGFGRIHMKAAHQEVHFPGVVSRLISHLCFGGRVKHSLGGSRKLLGRLPEGSPLAHEAGEISRRSDNPPAR